jgi:hypothetical protein
LKTRIPIAGSLGNLFATETNNRKIRIISRWESEIVKTGPTTDFQFVGNLTNVCS